MQNSTNGRILLLAAALTFTIACEAARAQLAPLAAKLPGGVNAVLALDVAKIIQSPLGKQMELQSKLVSGYADRPLAVPATARRVAIGAAVHPGGMRSIWEAAVIELSGAPRLEPMLQKQGGYLDRIEGKQAAWTPRDVFYVAMDAHTLAVARPGQRQLVRRWMAGQVDKTLPPYISSALTAAGDAHAVFAVDLDGAVSLAAVRYALGMGQLPSLEKIETVQDKLLSAVAAVEGMTLIMRVSAILNEVLPMRGKIRVEMTQKYGVEF